MTEFSAKIAAGGRVLKKKALATKQIKPESLQNKRIFIAIAFFYTTILIVAVAVTVVALQLQKCELIPVLAGSTGVIMFCLIHLILTKTHHFSAKALSILLSLIAIEFMLASSIPQGAIIWLLLLAPIVFFTMGLTWGLITILSVFSVACFILLNPTTASLNYPLLKRIHDLTAFAGMILLTASAQYAWDEAYKSMRNLTVQLESQAGRDPLTGLANRRLMYEMMTAERSHAERHKEPYSLIIIDIDHFKSLNDTYGHSVGDIVLEEAAKIFSSQLRKRDFLARWGGEEFLIILGKTNNQVGLAIAERIRSKLCNTPIHAQGHVLKVTASFGLYTSDLRIDLKEEIAIADKRLYKAKHKGRNCTVSSEIVSVDELTKSQISL